MASLVANPLSNLSKLMWIHSAIDSYFISDIAQTLLQEWLQVQRVCPRRDGVIVPVAMFLIPRELWFEMATHVTARCQECAPAGRHASQSAGQREDNAHRAPEQCPESSVHQRHAYTTRHPSPPPRVICMIIRPTSQSAAMVQSSGNSWSLNPTTVQQQIPSPNTYLLDAGLIQHPTLHTIR